jgi:glutaredoxin-related protein
MIKVYGSKMCSNTRDFKYNLDVYKIPYEFIDINSNLRNLKDFLSYRDKEECFSRIKKVGGIGIPLIIEDDGKARLGWQKYLEEVGIKKILHFAEECDTDEC